MNVQTRTFNRSLGQQPRTTGTEAPAVRRAVYRERAVGVGYGNSSGYAASRSYSPGWSGAQRFRCS